MLPLKLKCEDFTKQATETSHPKSRMLAAPLPIITRIDCVQKVTNSTNVTFATNLAPPLPSGFTAKHMPRVGVFCVAAKLYQKATIAYNLPKIFILGAIWVRNVV